MTGAEGTARQLARWVCVLGLIALVVASSPHGPARADDARPQGVLLLLPGQPTGTQTAIDAFGRGVRSALVEILPPGSSVYVEYTDLARLKTPAEQGKLRDWYTAKYASHPPDLIVAGGAEPRAFLASFRAELWPEVPIIFGGMDERSLQRFTLPARTTALTTRYEEAGTIRAALNALPETEHVALVAGTGPLDRYLRELWLEALAPFRDRIGLIDLSGLKLEELRARLAALPERTVVLLSSFFADGSGRTFVLPEVTPGFAAASNRPIFAIHDSVLGLGVVGGVLTDYGLLGRQTGQLAASVLSGAPLPESPVRATGVNQTVFDWRQLRRWSIDQRRLPVGATVRYRPPSAWELYRWQIVTGGSVLILQAVLIAALLVQRAQRARVQRQLDDQHRFDTFLAGLSRFFADVPAERIDHEIQVGLGRAGEFLAVDRVTLFELSRRNGRAQIIHAWTADGVEEIPTEMPAAAFPWMSEQLSRGRVVTFARRDDLPPEAATDRATFAMFDTAAHASVPLVEGGVTRRVLAVTCVRHERVWTTGGIEQLQLIAEVLGQILARKHAEIESAESQSLQQAMLRALPSRMAVVDADGRVLAVNRAWLEPAEYGDTSLMARAGVGTNYLEVCGEAAVAGEAGARETATALDAVLARRSDMMEAEYGEKRPGRERWYRLSVMGLRGARGGAVIARTDITDQVEARERFRQFSHHLLSAQEEERRRIARELHDDLNQRMVLLALDVSRLAQALPDGKGLESAQQIGARVGEIAEDLHALAYKLHPFRLEYLGLAGAARGLCSEIAAAHDLAVSFVDRDVPSSLSREAALCAYRVLQEALSNVVKHSGSSRAEVSLVGDGAELRLSVRDFGVGMSPEAARSTSGLGFSSIQERLRAVNGRFALDTSGPVGIELRAAIPLSAASIA